MIPPPVPGTPYHLLAGTPRRPRRSLGLAVAGAIFAVFAGLMVVCAVAVIGGATGRPAGRFGLPSFGDLGDAVWTLLVEAAFIPALMLAAQAGQGRAGGTLSSVCGRLRLRWLGACLLIAVLAELLFLGVDAVLEPTGSPVTFEWRGFVVAVPVLVALVPLQAAGEEYLFRGWLLQTLGGLGGSPWIAATGSAVLFALVHGLDTVAGFIDLVGFAVAVAWLTMRTGGLEAGIALHAATNLVGMVWQAATGTLSSTETAADSSWTTTVVDLTIVVAYAVVIGLLARRRRITAVVPEPADYRRAGTGTRIRSDATTTSPVNSSAASAANRSGSV